MKVYGMLERLGISNLEPTVADFIKPEAERLLAEIDDSNTGHFRRAAISDRLAEIGDQRAGVGLRSDGLPDIVWRPVTGGEVKLEGRADTYDVKPFNISIFPLTFIQYRSFIEAKDGYHDLRWWRTIPKQAQPPRQYRPLDNHPVERVSWYDAVAFCLWLSEKLAKKIRLPTEMEWQYAATGGDPSNLYPWGGSLDSRLLNTLESGLGRTTAVGMYPAGVSPIGAFDMAGNIWEWCLNKSNDPEDVAIEESEQRAVRGGCWHHPAVFSAAAFRNPDWDYSAPRSHLRGFRLVCSIQSSE